MKTTINSRFTTYLNLSLLFLTISYIPLSQAQAQQYLEGIHYATLEEPISTTVDTSEVMEVFWYGCGHCYAFEPLLESWQENNGAEVNFIRNPIVWSDTASHHGQLYFTAEVLGITNIVHGEIFDAIHQHNNYLLSKDEAKTFFMNYGVQGEDFDKAFQSFTVNTQLGKAKTMQRQAGISSVPTLIVNGKYQVSVNDGVRNHADLLKVVDYLLEKER